MACATLKHRQLRDRFPAVLVLPRSLAEAFLKLRCPSNAYANVLDRVLGGVLVPLVQRFEVIVVPQ